MSMLNPFTSNAFSVTALATAINRIPNKYNRLGQIGVFREVPITKKTFLAEEMTQIINMLNSVPRGGVAPKNTAGKRGMRTFTVPHVPLEDSLLPDDVQDVRAFGTESSDLAVGAALMDKLTAMRNKFDITREWHRMGAVKGIVMDPDTTVLYNYYTEFGVTQKVIDFALDVDTTDVNGKCRETLRYLEDQAQGESITGARALVSEEFFDKLVAHPTVKDAFRYYLTSNNLASDYRGDFPFAGIIFENYRANSTDPAGVARKFIAANEGHVVPLGATCLVEVVAPGTFMECVNSPGLPYYAKTQVRDFNMGMDIHAQMNILAFCSRPELLVKVTV